MATATKMVYQLREGSAQMVNLLGGKGAHVSEMARIGIPVPPGFVITTGACNEFYKLGRRFPEGMWEAVVDQIHVLEKATGKVFGGVKNPLIVSVRSGSPASMPGMMDTILNMGVVDDTVAGLAELMKQKRPALDAYRRFIQGFGSVVLGIEKNLFESQLDQKKQDKGFEYDHEIGSEDLSELVETFKRIVTDHTGTSLSQDPWDLLRQAIGAVFISWNNPRAVTYRDHNHIPHDLGTGCVIMAMVFGNLGADSGTGVLFTRNPANGANELFGEFLANAQGEDVVAGIRTPERLSSVAQSDPMIYEQIQQTALKLERHYRDVQDIEFTVEQGKLFILQTRSAKRTASAAVKFAVDFVEEGILSKEEALGLVSSDQIVQVLMPRFENGAKQRAIVDGLLVAQGLGGSPGAASGVAVMDPDRAVEMAEQGLKVVLMRPDTSPDDVHGIIKSEGVVTSRGGMTSHAAVVTRGLGKPCVVGCEELEFNIAQLEARSRGKTIREGDFISVDGGTGEVFLGDIERVLPDPEDLRELMLLLEWADDVRTLEVWGNADTPLDAMKAREYGAQGIGLCRTEHMFFAAERLPHIQKLLTVAPVASRLRMEMQRLELKLDVTPAIERQHVTAAIVRAREAVASSLQVKEFHDSLEKLEEFQTKDFYEIFKIMEGLPVVIRLLDAPLHEFLPHFDQLNADVAVLQEQRTKDKGRLLREKEQILQLVETLREVNPMMGHRGCRVGLTMPEIYEMQVRAIVTAANQLLIEGYKIYPEVMIPMVSHVNEVVRLRRQLDTVAAETTAKLKSNVTYEFGTMIEVPRAALTAGRIAEEVEFFSFGSNDLTQMTYAFSRDDAEAKFLRDYLTEEILPENPFESLDIDGVGQLMRIAAHEGRATKPGLKIGICGEHGGDPKSIAFCYSLGLNYVSASPYRVPVARLAAAQSALGQLTPG